MDPTSGDPRLEFDLADRLRKSLRVSGMNMQDMADKIGMNRNTVARYLAGKWTPDHRTLVAWAFHAQVPLTWLETGEADAEPRHPWLLGGSWTAPRPAAKTDAA
jgi:transcriptional regulator with XRE-family HTH domain